MKLYLHDNKHEQIIAEMDLGEITETEKLLIAKIIGFLDDKEITNRYKRLVLAEKAHIVYNDGFSEVVFDDLNSTEEEDD